MVMTHIILSLILFLFLFSSPQGGQGFVIRQELSDLLKSTSAAMDVLLIMANETLNSVKTNKNLYNFITDMKVL